MEDDLRVVKSMLFALCGPSGVGKGTLTRLLIERNNQIIRCPSWTTRPQRAGEINGVNYHYTDTQEFLTLKEQGDLIGSFKKQFGFLYGVRFSEIQDILKQNCSALVESNLIDVTYIKERLAHVVVIFIAPPSIDELSRRLHGRARENNTEIADRLTQAQQMLNGVFSSQVDYYVINDDIENCVHTLRSIFHAEIHRLRSRNPSPEKRMRNNNGYKNIPPGFTKS